MCMVSNVPGAVEICFDTPGVGARLTPCGVGPRFAFACRPRDDFPGGADDNLPTGFELPAKELARLVDKARFAISTEETRYYLNGIYLHAADQDGDAMLRAVATDGHRLALVQMALPHGAEGMPDVIVPRKTVTEVRKLVDDVSGTVGIALSETKIKFTVGTVTLTSKLIDGTFPDYNRVIPQGNDKILKVDGASFAAAVDRVSTISTEKSRAVKLAIGTDAVELSANSPDAGSAVEEIAASYGAEPLEVGFNAKYLLDITTQIDGDEAEFVMADSGSPTIVRDGDDDGALYVLMPMRV